jgi:protein-arginine kinase activator protein McsA
MIFIDLDNKHYDICFLEKRLRYLISIEEYERAMVVRNWINDLAWLHHGVNSEQLNKLIIAI